MAEDDTKFEQVANYYEMQRLGEMKEETLKFIHELRGRISQMGANDSELTILNDVITRVDKGEMGLPEAREIANNILDRKQDYH